MLILNEIILQKPILEEMSKDKLPEGVLCRVTYPICNIGERNANHRVYEKAVWDKVLESQDLREKLENRALFGHAEHPEQTQSDLQLTSHVIFEMWIDEEQNKVYQKFDVLDTPTGRIVDTLLRAGCNVGVSTRAEGDLEEKEDDDGPYSRVIPERFGYETTDFTADPSTFGVMPLDVKRNVVAEVRKGLKVLKKDERKFAQLVLESIKCGDESKCKKCGCCEALKEGTWALPHTREDAEKITRLLENPLSPERAKEVLYNLLGDDILYDAFDEAIDNKVTDVRPEVKAWITHRIEEVEDTDPKVVEILRTITLERKTIEDLMKQELIKIGALVEYKKKKCKVAKIEEGTVSISMPGVDSGGGKHVDIDGATYVTIHPDNSIVIQPKEDILKPTEEPAISGDEIPTSQEDAAGPELKPGMAVETKDGKKGKVLSIDESGINIETEDGVQITLDTSQVKITLPDAKEEIPITGTIPEEEPEEEEPIEKEVPVESKVDEAKMGVDYIRTMKASVKTATTALKDKDYEAAAKALEAAADDASDAARAAKKMKREEDAKAEAEKEKTEESKVDEGLESHANRILGTAGFTYGEDYGWDKSSIIVYDKNDAEKIMKTLDTSGEFGPTSFDKATGKIKIGEFKESKVDEGITSTIFSILRDRGYEVDYGELQDYLKDLNTDDYIALEQAANIGDEDEITRILRDVGFTESKVDETEDIHAMYKAAGLPAPDGKGIHTKAFHELAIEVAKGYVKAGDTGQEALDKAYPTAMKQLGKEKAVHKAHRSSESKVDEKRIQVRFTTDEEKAAVNNLVDKYQEKGVSITKFAEETIIDGDEKIIAELRSDLQHFIVRYPGIDIDESKSISTIAKEIKELRILEASTRAERDKAFELLEQAVGSNKTLEVKMLLKKIKEVTTIDENIISALRSKLEEKASLAKESNEELAVVKSDFEKGFGELKETITAVGVKNQEDLDSIREEHRKEIEDVKEKTAVEAVKDVRNEFLKQFIKLRIAESGLKIDDNSQALLEKCNSLEEVDDILDEIRDIKRRGALHSKPIEELTVVRSRHVDPEQSTISKSVDKVFEGFGYAKKG